MKASSPSSQDDTGRLKALLDSRHSWPGEYLFKFIVKQENLSLAAALFGSLSKDREISYRQSGQGKYVAMSFSLLMKSSDEVLAVYSKARAIPGLIAL